MGRRGGAALAGEGRGFEATLAAFVHARRKGYRVSRTTISTWAE